ncbi:G-type lectin S-receptor-like serine/threonine-protein kinase RKS1 [Macadamia integrifolia]|uniref:G-type lectin S-receptor-like serine/threonine-protein kinase RKS1 n=1 Tax=Macadamia integrifolia TaxID=60698 RepID=UPI001C4F14D3|nr:G-type lectin S-receptor-like serine/threonine-protein kinase RKS1 [Macadamia integrifolia]
MTNPILSLVSFFFCDSVAVNKKKASINVMFTPTWICFLLLFHFYISIAASVPSPTDTLKPTESITDDRQNRKIVVSAESNFALGFFSPGTSSYRYVGIWFHKIPEATVVWVANRDNPINDSSGVLSVALDGNLVITSNSDQRHPLWSTNVSISSNTTVLQLLETGNLVLYSGGDRSRILWQSFDHPTHAFLPGMKVGLNRRTGLNWVWTSWKSKDDPSPGIYSYRMDTRGSPQTILYKGSAPLWRAGSWNGQRLSGVPAMNQPYNYLFTDDFVNTTDELYMTYNVYNSSVYLQFVIDDSGTILSMIWVENRWTTFYEFPSDKCDYYGQCGAYGSCRIPEENAVECACLPGFQPKSPRQWNLKEWSDGCVRKRNLGCGKGDVFSKLVGVKLPDTSMSLVDNNLSLKECEQQCLKNCSCTAYAAADITGGGSGCIAWFDNLTDIRYFTYSGQDLYIRVDSVELAAQARTDKGFLHKQRVTILTVSLVMGVLLFGACVYRLLKKKKGKEKKSSFLNVLIASPVAS